MTKLLEDLAEVVRIRNGYLVGDAPYWIEKLKVSDSFIERYHATITDMAKRLDAAERDAERWRYLRKEVISASWLINGGSIVKTLDDSCDPSAFDKAIDAAMQESGEWTEGVG